MQIYSNTLTSESVSIQSDEYGMRAYVNSTRGRAQLEAECPEDVVQKVYTVWGSAPTVTEPDPPAQPVNMGPSATEQLRADVDYLSVMTGVTLT
jgi:hypothetical protein